MMVKVEDLVDDMLDEMTPRQRKLWDIFIEGMDLDKVSESEKLLTANFGVGSEHMDIFLSDLLSITMHLNNPDIRYAFMLLYVNHSNSNDESMMPIIKKSMEKLISWRNDLFKITKGE